MAAVSSPLTIDLSSDSESEIRTAIQSEDVFTVDCTENDCLQDNLNIDNLESEVAKGKWNTSISDVKINDLIINYENPIQNKNLSKEKRKLENKVLREEKKAEELKQKRMKAALAKKHKSLKPEENIKLLTVHIDTKIVNSELGGVVITSLTQSGIQYDVGNNIKANTVTWSKKVKDIIISSDGITEEDICEKEEDQLLYLIYSHELVKLVDNNELLTHIHTIKSVYYDKLVTVVIFGMQKYFDLQKRKNINEKNGKKRSKKNGMNLDDHIYITKDEYESALIELQLVGKCDSWPIETGEELASLVVSTTKSLSQIDYKKEKQRREEGELEWFAKADSKQCVRVDKNGNGLMKLWQQQICQFNAVGIEFANAITSHFHSPLHLVNSYKNCETLAEAELLLQNIQMRREAGILSSSRRIGPEVSKKLFRFYTSDNPDLEL